MRMLPARLGTSAGIATLLAALAAASAALAAPPWVRNQDPDWPCEQIKVSDLSLAAFWTGPSIDPYVKTWPQDPEIADLAERLAQRRVPLDQAQAEINAFAKNAGSQRKDKLLALLAGLFSTLDEQRGSVLAGLDRFGGRQKELAEQIRSELDKLHELQGAANPDTQHIVALGEKLKWETELFEKRREAVRYVCQVPDMIEQRLFALARTIQQDLG